MSKETISVTIRAILQAVAGGLVSKGLVDQDLVEPIIGGVIAVATVFWSMAHKKQIRKDAQTTVITKP